MAALVALCLGTASYAQRIVPEQPMKQVSLDTTFQLLMSMTAEDYENLVLPPLQDLFESARQSSSILMMDKDVEITSRELKTVRRRWLDYLRVYSSYTYGNSDISAVQYMETTYPVWNLVTSNNVQSYYNVGATVSIPLETFFNQRNKVRQQRARVEYAEMKRDSEFDLVKKEIIRYYTTILEKRSVLKVAAEAVVAAQAQYSVSEVDFVNGNMNAQELYQRKSYETNATKEYESVRADLNEALLCLEVITCTPIINRH